MTFLRSTACAEKGGYLLSRSCPGSAAPPTLDDYRSLTRGNRALCGGKRGGGSSPKFSIVTVVRNDEEKIGRTIESVLSQRYDDYEYIVVDGASTDGTLEVIRRYDRHIDFWMSEPDLGISDAFNKGIALSRGAYIQLLNSGDTLIGTDVLAFAGACSEEPVITGFARLDASTVPPRPLRNSDPLRKRSLISHQASFVRRDVYRLIGLYDLDFRIRMDYEFWLRCLRLYRFLFVDRVLVEFHAGASMEEVRSFYQEEFFANVRHDRAGILNYCRVSQKFLFRTILRRLGRKY